MRRAWPWFSALLLAACGPIGPIPGGKLRGDSASEPVADWSFTDAHHAAQLETRPADPYSVNTWCVGYRDSLYVPTSMIRGPGDPMEREWVRNVVEDPRVRIRIGDTIYERRAQRVTDGAEFAAVRARLIEKYGLEGGEPDPNRNVWLFRLGPR